MLVSRGYEFVRLEFLCRLSRVGDIYRNTSLAKFLLMLTNNTSKSFEVTNMKIPNSICMLRTFLGMAKLHAMHFIGKVAIKVLLALTLTFSVNGFSAVDPLSVSGNRVLAGGIEKSFAGASLFWSNNGWGGEKYYNSDVVGWLKHDWQVSIVRAAMGVEDNGGYLSDKAGNAAKVRAVVDAAIAHDMYVIIDWHSHHAENYQQQAIAFFQDMAREYGHTANVIYEIYNEPINTAWDSGIKPYAEAVIAAIRAIDPDNLIIVGTRQWSQRVDEASWNPITSYDNIAYTLHFYAGTHFDTQRGWAQTALDNGIALFATEWGTVNANGDGGVNKANTDRWMDFLLANNISHANWSVNDKAEGASAMFPGASPSGGWGNLTASGRKVKSIIRQWPHKSGGATVPTPTPTPTPTATPCASVAVPAILQAEHYCQMQGVRTENTSDIGGGLNVGWLDSGDWLRYQINAPVDGQYTLSFRVAALQNGGRMRLGGNGDVISIPATGGWQNWITISTTIGLSSGPQAIELYVDGPGWNLNWFDIQASTSPTPQPTPSPDIIVIQAEDFTQMSGIRVENTSDIGGGENVGWIDPGDWLSYPSVYIPSSGRYVVEYRVASALAGGSLWLEEAGGSPAYGTVSFPGTGGWQNWITVSHTVDLAAGNRRFGLALNSGGWNLNWIKIRPAAD